MEQNSNPTAASPVLPNNIIPPIQRKPTHYAVLIISLFILMGIVFAAGYFLGIGKILETNTSLVPQAVSPQTEKQTLKGTVALKEGTLEIKQAESWNAIDKNYLLKEGDNIRTGEASRAVIEMDDGSSIRLDQNTQIEIAALSSEVIMVKQDTGRVYHRVNKGNLLYTVKSLDSIATALGTSFSVNTNTQTQETQVVVFESKVSLISKGNIDTKAEVNKGQMASVAKDEKVKLVAYNTETTKETFYTWNKELDKADTPASPATATEQKEAKEPENKQETTQNVPAAGTLTLSAQAKEGAVTLSWTLSGSAQNGFKVAKSTNPDPTYPPREGDQAQLVSSETRSYTWYGLSSGQTYHFRVGIYNGSGGVSAYSNDVTAVPLAGTSSSSGNISLSAASTETGKVKLNWSLTGESPNGFKTVWSVDPNPTYPEDNWHYLGSSGSREDTFEGLSSGQSLHFRACIYVGGEHPCSSYSNDVTVTVQ